MDLASKDSEAASLDLKANYCSDSRTLPSEVAKYLFVIDMSSSNIGAWDTDPKVGNSIPPSYWDVSKATDFDGNRFSAVSRFLSTCGNQAGAQFAVVGFSNGAGILSGTGASAALDCTNVTFGSANTTLANLQALANVQESEKPWFLQWKRSQGRYVTDPNFPPILSATSYHSAMACAQNAVVKDLNSTATNLTDNYHVFFLSDGMPADPRDGLCNKAGMSEAQKLDCQVENTVDSTSIMRLSAFARGKNLRIHTLFYGASSTIPTLMTRMASEGGTGGVATLDKFDYNSNAVCALLANQLSVDLRPDSMAVMNMTTARKFGKLVADSDMDGLTDEEEIDLGYDPSHPRSRVNGVLDGVCEQLGGLTECQARRATVTCNENVMNASGLTECDARMLQLENFRNLPDWGVDSDLDGIIDFIEIVKGSDPTRSDMVSDPDADTMITRLELQRGTDPKLNDKGIPSYKLNEIDIVFEPQSSISTCSYGSWSAKIRRIQAAPTLAVQAWPAPFDFLNHAAGEQVVTFLYRLTPSNAVIPVSEYYWTSARVTVDLTTDPDAPSVIQQSNSNFVKTDFLAIGKVSP